MESDLIEHLYSLCQRMVCLYSLLGVLWSHVLYLSLWVILNLFLGVVRGYVLVSLISCSCPVSPAPLTVVVLIPDLGAWGRDIITPSRCILEKSQRILSLVLVSPKKVLPSAAVPPLSRNIFPLHYLSYAQNLLLIQSFPHPQGCYIKIRNLLFIDLLTLGPLLLWVGLNYYWCICFVLVGETV